MELIQRHKHNPILSPDPSAEWEKDGAFNGCPVLHKGNIHLLYRAVSTDRDYQGVHLKLSTIGHAVSKDGFSFEKKGQLLVPEYDWEKYGLEDPRVCKFDDTYYIFYTALSGYPFGAENIKIGVAMTKDFKKFTKKPVTTFNSKAMTLFPSRINRKMTAILTLHTDTPPAKIAVVQFNKPEDLWSKTFWDTWHAQHSEYVVPLHRSPYDHIEIGAAPIKTKHGWLLIYSYIQNYFNGPATFGIEAVLLDLNDPRKILARSKEPLLQPEADYEKKGQVANIAFPSGAFVDEGKLYLYYGAADTTCCVAVGYLNDILHSLLPIEKLERFENNPILTPSEDIEWSAKAIFNPAALRIDKTTHVLYRAMSAHNTSVFGHATSKDGYTLAEIDEEPAYVPRIQMEQKLTDGNTGCEDPRLTLIGKTVYMCYTAYNGKDFPHVAFTSIPLADFKNRKWTWKTPIIISPAGVDDKDAAIFPEKIHGKYAFLHRLGKEIWIDYKPHLDDLESNRLQGQILMSPRQGMWDDDKIGISSPPILTDAGWLLLYHGICKRDYHYRVGAALLSKLDPGLVIGRTDEPLLEPELPFELEGEVKNVVFPCGAVVEKGRLFVYYGGADKVLCSASLDLKRLITWLKKSKA